RDHWHLLSFPTRRSSDLLWRVSNSVLGFSLMMRTRPKFEPTLVAHSTSDGHTVALSVQIPSLSALPWSQKPRHSISPSADAIGADRKSTRLNSSHVSISY